MDKAGDTAEEISCKIGISVDAVRKSIKSVESQRFVRAPEIVDLVVNHEAIAALRGASDKLLAAQEATTFTGAYDPDTNEPIMAPDHTTILAAIETVSKMIERTRKKDSGINIGIVNNPNGNGGNNGQVRSFEQRVRERRGLLTGGNAKFLSSGQSDSGQSDQIVDAELVTDEDDEDNEGELIEVGDGTSDAEMEETESESE